MSEEKGSLWRKWDLHVHAPSKYTCAKNDCYEGNDLTDKQNKFIDELKNVKAISVIGITDYFSLEGYKKVMENISDLGHFDLIIPNIEIRITPVTGKGKKINLHLIPNTSVLSIEDIERFLYKFEFGPEKYTCQEVDLIKLGKKMDTAASPEMSFVKGLNEFAISYDTFFNEFNNLPAKTKENIIIGVSNNSGDGASGIKDIQGIRDIIYNGVDFIFSSQPSDSIYFTGQGIDSFDKIIETYGSLKPCLHGSDYHGSKDGSKICIPALDRFCWIKSDPNFEGLKQVLIEPIERVFIGKEPGIFDRVLQNQTKYIKQIEIAKAHTYENQYGKWFENVKIELNPELVAIIGNKGSGKSAIADILALCGNFNKSSSFSFLHPKKFRKGNLAKHFTGKLTWISGGTQERCLCDDPEADDLPNVKYLPQGDFEDLTNEIEKTQSFQSEIESVVFSHLEEEERLSFKNFNELIESKKAFTEKEVKIVQNEIEELNFEIIKLERKKNPKHLSQLQGQLKQKNEELKALVVPVEIKDPNSDLLSGLNKGTLQKIEKIRKDIDDLKNQINSKRQKKQELSIEKFDVENLIQEIKLKEHEIITFQKEYAVLISKYNLKVEDVISLRTNFTDIEKIIKSKDVEILKLDAEIGNNQLVLQPNTLLSKLKLAEDEMQVEQSKLDSTQKDYQNYLQEKSIYEARKIEIEGSLDKPNTIKFIEQEIHYITFDIDKDIEQKRIDRLVLVKKIFALKQQIIKIYQTVKKRIDKKIEENKNLLENYNINIDASFVYKPDFETKFFHFISLNKAGSFYGKESAQVQLLKSLEDCDANKIEDIEGFLNKIIKLLTTDNRENQNNDIRYIDEQVNDLGEFYKYLFSLDYIDYNYKLKLGEKHLDQLSPGERGALLLVFYLLLDKNDIPLILDQPEDNLDNHSVANVLVPFIRRAKQKRQIILVTHNPNLAVVADAEQIIWVDIDKKDKNKFKYHTGSIEDREINEKIVNVLEGAMPAFNKRKQKYYE